MCDVSVLSQPPVIGHNMLETVKQHANPWFHLPYHTDCTSYSPVKLTFLSPWLVILFLLLILSTMQHHITVIFHEHHNLVSNCGDNRVSHCNCIMYFAGKHESMLNLDFDTAPLPTGRGLVDQFVTTSNRNPKSIRAEIVEATYNFLAERLDPEQEAVIVTMKALLSARVLQDFVSSGLILSDKLFPGEDGNFADEACEQWNTISDVPYLPAGADLGCSLSVRLRQLLPVTTGLVQRVMSAIATLSPHSMQTERIVSHHNLVVDDHRTVMKSETINARLHIALNGVGTAHYDPRSAVVHFLESKDRREREPTVEIYAQRDFIKKFFRKSGHFFLAH